MKSPLAPALAPLLRKRSPCFSIEALESRIAPAVFIVTSVADSGAGTLRNALSLADAHPGPDTILFHLPAPAAHGANIITLTSGVLTSTGGVTIRGPGAGNLIIDANYSSGVFYINSGDITKDNPATITGLSIVDGKSTGNGGGIYSSVSLTLKDVVISGNVAGIAGGGVAVTGYAATGMKVAISNSLITGNYGQGGSGGGMYLSNLNAITISNTVVTGNAAAGEAGGIYAAVSGPHPGGIAITGSVISGNSAATAGGLFVTDYSTAHSSGITISRTKITGNTAIGTGSGGGGLLIGDGNTVISRSTVEGNTAVYYGGGIADHGWRSLTISRSTISGNKTTKANTGYEGGGGLFFDNDGSPAPSALKIIGSQITDNQSAASGGGVYALDGVAVTISRSTFSGDQAALNGGGLCAFGQGALKVNLSVTRSGFLGNSAQFGGGIYAGDHDAAGAGGAFSISASRITGNSSVQAGGGVYLNGSASAIVKDSVFSSNIAGTYAGGLSISDVTVFHIGGGSITRNAAFNNSGGGINIALSAGTIFDITISGNSAAVGGGIYNDSTTPDSIILDAAKVFGNTGLYGPNLEDAPGDLSTFKFL